jgi:hypothetical protein
MATRLALEGEAETIRIAVTDRETPDGKFACVGDQAFRQTDQLQRDRRSSFAPQPGKHPYDDVKCVRSAMDRHLIGALPQTKGRKEAGNTEHVVEMAMSQQQPVKPSEARACAHQLALRTLSAIHQDALISCFDEKTRVIAFGRRNTRRRSQEGEREHWWWPGILVDLSGRTPPVD